MTEATGEIKISNRPEIQSQVEAKKQELEEVIPSTPFQGKRRAFAINQLARNFVAKTLRIDRLRKSEAGWKHVADVESQVAIIDSLTEIYNRRGFDKKMRETLQRAGRKEETVSLLHFDLNFFKELNDTKGHNAGDEMLKTVAKILESNSRVGLDFAARMGEKGDEFALVVANGDPQHIRVLFDRLNLQFNQHNINLGAGVATIRPEELSFLAQKLDPKEMEDKMLQVITGLREKADVAMYAAKKDAKFEGHNILYSYEEIQNIAISRPVPPETTKIEDNPQEPQHEELSAEAKSYLDKFSQAGENENRANIENLIERVKITLLNEGRTGKLYAVGGTVNKELPRKDIDMILALNLVTPGNSDSRDTAFERAESRFEDFRGIVENLLKNSGFNITEVKEPYPDHDVPSMAAIDGTITIKGAQGIPIELIVTPQEDIPQNNEHPAIMLTQVK